MAFEYTGVQSLVNPEIFYKILASAVEETALAADFEINDNNLIQVDAAQKYFAYHYMQIEWSGELRESKRSILAVALAIHAIALHPPISRPLFVYADDKPVGLLDAIAHRNPNELIALVFGMAIAELQTELKNSAGNIMYFPSRLNLRSIRPADLRDAVRVIAENKNRDLGASHGQFRRAFHRLATLMRRLRVHRFSRHR